MSSDKTHLVVNAVGVDRPGMVADLSNLVLKAGGNVSESQASLLGKHFALMMLVTVPSSNAALLQTSIANVTDMKTAIFETEDPKKIQITPKIVCKCPCSLDSSTVSIFKTSPNFVRNPSRAILSCVFCLCSCTHAFWSWSLCCASIILFKRFGAFCSMGGQ